MIFHLHFTCFLHFYTSSAFRILFRTTSLDISSNDYRNAFLLSHPYHLSLFCRGHAVSLFHKASASPPAKRASSRLRSTGGSAGGGGGGSTVKRKDLSSTESSSTSSSAATDDEEDDDDDEVRLTVAIVAGQSLPILFVLQR